MIRSLAFAAAFYLVTALFLILGLPLLLAPRSWAMAGLKAHARTCLWLTHHVAGIGVEVRGRENLPEGGCLVAAKHQSAWDTFALIPLFRDPALVMKAELMRIPVYGWFSRKFGMIAVRRDKGPSALRAMLKVARARAGEGREVLIFPEGTRRSPGAPPDYKSGILPLYEALGVPCVPIALNSGLYWPRRTIARHPGRIIVEILPAIPPGLSRREFQITLQRQIETAADRLLAEAARGPGAPPLPQSARARLAELAGQGAEPTAGDHGG
ncbi:MAG: lysophospholipid acyltransferase family protein [Hyphomicrobiaceae bacterium]